MGSACGKCRQFRVHELTHSDGSFQINHRVCPFKIILRCANKMEKFHLTSVRQHEWQKLFHRFSACGDKTMPTINELAIVAASSLQQLLFNFLKNCVFVMWIISSIILFIFIFFTFALLQYLTLTWPLPVSLLIKLRKIYKFFKNRSPRQCKKRYHSSALLSSKLFAAFRW